MRARRNTCWLALSLAAWAGAALCAADDKPTVHLARFAIIYPAADPALEEKQLSPGALWLRLPKPPARKPTSASTGKNRQSTVKQNDESRIAPLRRERPKRESDPPKTRRRQLGW